MIEKIILVKKDTFGNSPAENSEAEEIMLQLVKKAIANNNTWTDIPLEELNVGQPANRMAFESPTREGVVNLITSQMATIIKVDGQQKLHPTDRFINWYTQYSKSH